MKTRFSTLHGACRHLLELLALGHAWSVAEASVLTVSHGQASFRYNDSTTFDALTGRMVISDGDTYPGPDVTRQGTLFDSWEIAPYSGLQTRIAGGQLL